MYDQFASEYDRFVNWQNRLAAEIPFIEKALREVNSAQTEPLKILDTACGTGMHALALAKDGYKVVGTDYSSKMVDMARTNAITAGIGVRFETAGFGSISKTLSNEQFDGLMCLGNSLPHLLTTSELQSALNDFSVCLKPGGLILIQNRNFDAVMANKDRWMEPQSFQEGDKYWVFQRFYDFNADGTISFNIVTLKRSANDPWSSSVLSTLLKPMLYEELLTALTAAGFDQIKVYGSLAGEPFNPNSSGNLVFTAIKK